MLFFQKWSMKSLNWRTNWISDSFNVSKFSSNSKLSFRSLFSWRRRLLNSLSQYMLSMLIMIIWECWWRYSLFLTWILHSRVRPKTLLRTWSSSSFIEILDWWFSDASTHQFVDGRCLDTLIVDNWYSIWIYNIIFFWT